MGRPVVALLDPHNPYAASLARVAWTHFDLGVICLWSDEDRWRRAETSERMRPVRPVAHYRYVPGQVAALTRTLMRRHDVVAVLPPHESVVLDAAVLAESLDVAWCDPQIVRRFRDKGSLKQALRSVAGGPRVNASVVVRDLVDVRRAQAEGSFVRFVLKPNDGMNNNRIGFFGPDSTDDEIRRHLALCERGPTLMEEFLDGQEFCVNGQVGVDGRVTVHAVYRTRHVAANGRPQLAARFDLVSSTDPDFDLTASYARCVVAATGLTRSPFHMELMVDASGPCLIEVAARHGGVGMAYDIADAHGGALDAFVVALAAYLGQPAPRAQKPDWSAYDSRGLRIVCAINERSSRIGSVSGVAQAEALPEFLRWVSRPTLGALVTPTVDLPSSPWILTLAGDSPDRLEAAEATARSLIRFNRRPVDSFQVGLRAHTVTMRAARRVSLLPAVTRSRVTSGSAVH